MPRKDACSRCRETRKSPKSPGWKQSPRGLLCGGCFKECYRAVGCSVPIHGPAGGEWEPLRDALAASWGLATSLANWCVRRLLAADPGRMPGQTKLAPMPKVDLYNAAFVRREYPGYAAWEGAKGSASAVTHAVGRRYQADRLAVQWQGSERPEYYRYPFPWPVRRQEWAFGPGPHTLEIQLPGGRFAVALKRGPEFARQHALLDMVRRGEAVGGETKIRRQRCHEDRRHGRHVLAERGAGGARRQAYVEIVTAAVWIPRAERKEGRKSLVLATAPEAFWVARLDGRDARPWVLNADHVRRREARHAAFLQRAGEDLKPEKRWPKRRRVQINEMREVRCRNHNNFVASWCQEAAAMLSKYAARQGCGTVVYSDAVRDYLPGFAWHRLRSALAHRLDADGIELVAGAATEGEENVA